MSERLVVVVGYDGAELLDLACVTSPLHVANHVGASPPYTVRVASPGGRPIGCDSGLVLHSQRVLERVRGPIDTLIVAGGLGHERFADDPRFVGHVRRLARESRRVASVCTGASVLAAAGLLDGRRATTHWRYASRLAARHPRVTVDPGPIYIRDGTVTTGAGVTSGLDLTLAFIAEDHGARLARWVARALVTYLQRPGDQRQMSMFTSPRAPGHRLLREVVDHITANLDGDLSSATLARRAGVSERHLARLFVEHLGQTPGRYVRRARTEAAAHLLCATVLPVAGVARRCGFGSAETLRVAFVERYGTTPSRYRATQTVPDADPARS
jgi:transcriptional regulator GlxA family with amidase domain